MRMIGAMFNGKPVIGFKNGNSTPVEYHSWRDPELADRLGGATLKFEYDSANPISITDFSQCNYNNFYLLTSNSDYFIQELGSYDTPEAAEDYSWMRNVFTTSLTIANPSTGYTKKIYECVTTVYQDNKANTSRVESVKENVRLTELTVPSDFGDLYSASGTMYGIHCKVDDYHVKKRAYQLATLTGNENINTSMVLIPEFPNNADTLLVPTIPTPDEYGGINLGDQFILYGAELTWKEEYDGEMYDTTGVWYVQAGLHANYNQETYEPDGTYQFVVQGSEQMQAQTLFAKQYGSSTVDYPNSAIVTPAFPVSCLLKNLTPYPLNTSSPLYPYIKKIQWTED